MNVIFSIFASLGIGFFVRKRSTALVSYLIADSFLFTFQTLDVLLNWMHGKNGVTGDAAFGPFPTGLPLDYKESEVYAYGIVNLVIVLIGVGLTIGSNTLAARRVAKRNVVSVG
jgi:hypothetical protein